MLEALGFCWEMRSEINRRVRTQQSQSQPPPQDGSALSGDQDQQDGQSDLGLGSAATGTAAPKRGRPTKGSVRGRAQELADEASIIETEEEYPGGEELEEDVEVAAELLTADAREVNAV